MAQEFHRYLIEGEDSRNVGDYDIVVLGFSREEAEDQVERAQKFLELAKRLIGNPQG